MEDRLSALESHVRELARSLGEVERRLSRLEGSGVEAPLPSPEAPAAAPAAAAAEVDFVGTLGLVGRTLLGLAGAYLVRALTSEGVLPEALGVAAGLAYAALWIVLADRAGARGRPLAAAFHGSTAVLVGVPLIWETTARFEILPPPLAAAALAGLTALSLAAGWRRDLRAPVWIVSLGAGTAALLLGGSTHAPAPFATFLVLLGVATLWVAEARGWRGLPWLTAAFADLAVLLLWMEDTVDEGLASAAGVAAIQIALFVLYAASFGRIVRRRVTVLAVAQTAAAVAVGYGGAVATLRGVPAAAAVLGAASVVAAAALYAGAFATIDPRRKGQVLFYTGLAAALLLGGSALLLARPAAVWAVLALAACALGSRFSRFVPSLHAALYVVAAAAASGLLRHTAAAWTGAEWPELTAVGLTTLAAAAACLLFLVRGDHAFWHRWERLPRLVFMVLVVAAGGGLVVRGAVLLVPAADPGTLATLRTAVLSAAALGLAAAGRRERLREAALLVYPVLILGAVKLLVEDFPAGRPETLFVALALYGAALILAPRLRTPGPLS